MYNITMYNKSMIPCYKHEQLVANKTSWLLRELTPTTSIMQNSLIIYFYPFLFINYSLMIVANLWVKSTTIKKKYFIWQKKYKMWQLCICTSYCNKDYVPLTLFQSRGQTSRKTLFVSNHKIKKQKVAVCFNHEGVWFDHLDIINHYF